MEMMRPYPAEQEPEIVIERANPEDAASIAHIQHESWLATYPNEEYGISADDIRAQGFEREERINVWTERLGNESDLVQTLVARRDGIVIGYSSAVKREDSNFIYSIYLLPEFQGQGVGSKLLTQVLEWLGDDKDTALGVVPYNKTAIAFYEKFGFEVRNPVMHDTPMLANGTDMPEVEMFRPKRENNPS